VKWSITVSVRRKPTELESTLAFAIGGGLALLILGFALASIQSALPNFIPQGLNLVMIVGGLLFVGGIVTWLAAGRPWKDFDNWSKPLFAGHDSAHENGHEEAIDIESQPDLATLGTHHLESHTAYTAYTTHGADDLKIIEGIGPKIAQALKGAGILTFVDLAARHPDDVERIVRDAGIRVVAHTDTWVEQAKLAAEGKMAALEQYKQQLRSQSRQ
jgi:predicted flap endonuclease-1-like 5' DNA nuclease